MQCRDERRRRWRRAVRRAPCPKGRRAAATLPRPHAPGHRGSTGCTRTSSARRACPPWSPQQRQLGPSLLLATCARTSSWLARVAGHEVKHTHTTYVLPRANAALVNGPLSVPSGVQVRRGMLRARAQHHLMQQVEVGQLIRASTAHEHTQLAGLLDELQHAQLAGRVEQPVEDEHVCGHRIAYASTHCSSVLHRPAAARQGRPAVRGETSTATGSASMPGWP